MFGMAATQNVLNVRGKREKLRVENCSVNWVAKRSWGWLSCLLSYMCVYNVDARVHILYMSMCILRQYIKNFGLNSGCLRLHNELKNSKCQKINQSNQKLLLDVFAVFLRIDFTELPLIDFCWKPFHAINFQNVIKQRLMSILHAVIVHMCKLRRWRRTVQYCQSQRSINETHLTYSIVRNRMKFGCKAFYYTNKTYKNSDWGFPMLCDVFFSVLLLGKTDELHKSPAENIVCNTSSSTVQRTRF